MQQEKKAAARRREELGLVRDQAAADGEADPERTAALTWSGRAIGRTDDLIDDWARNGRNTPTGQSVLAGLEAKRAALETARKEAAAG